jgi:WD40 repeat protein
MKQTEPVAQVGHTSTVEAIAFNPAFDVLASGGRDDQIVLWHTPSGRRLRTLRSHRTGVDALAFSADGLRLASQAHNGEIILWDVVTGERLSRLDPEAWLPCGEDPEHVLSSISLADNGRIAATASGGFLLWDGRATQPLRVLSGATNVVQFVDNRLLASADCDGFVRIWDAASGRLVRTLDGQCGERLCLAVSRSAGLIAAGSATCIHTWAIDAWRPARSFAVRNTRVLSIDISPDGRRLAAATMRGGLRLYDLHGRSRASRIGDPRACVDAVAFDRSGRTLASIGRYGLHVDLWSPDSGRTRRVRGANRCVSRAVFHLDTTTIVGVERWHAVNTLDGDGRRRTALLDTGQSRHTGRSRDSSIVAVDRPDGQAEVYAVERGWDRRVLSGHVGEVRNIAVSPNGRRVASADDNDTVRVWDVETGEVRATFQVETPDWGVLLNVVEDAVAYQWRPDVVTCARLTAPFYSVEIGCEEPIEDFELSDDGSLLVTVGPEGTIRVFEVPTGRLLNAIDVSWTAFALSPDGTTLAWAGDQDALTLCDVRTGRRRRTSGPIAAGAESVTFTAAGEGVVTAHVDGSIKLWSSADAALQATVFLLEKRAWLITTPGDEYDGSTGALRYLHTVHGLDARPLPAASRPRCVRGLVVELARRIRAGRPAYQPA